MFGMSFTEILVIAIIAILFLGPEKLPDAMVQVAKFFRSLKKAIYGAKEALDQEIKIQELKESAMNYKDKIKNSVEEIEKEADLQTIKDLPSKLDSIEDILADEPAEDSSKPKKKSTKENRDV
ncbi:MAG: Sec-independent protein translocase subunit TatB [Epsilonproteobacteria bacterium]|nr:Sec-independent protein translocase subunit TatB [Campylobacterota bacterium]